MLQNKELIRYYLLVFLPFLFVWAILKAMGSSTYNQLIYALGFFWPVTVNAPGFNEKVTSKKYRFSLLRIIYLFDNLFKKIGKKTGFFVLSRIISSLAPLFFGLAIILISQLGDIFFMILGVTLAELLLEIRSRYE